MARKGWRRLESARCPGRTAWRPGHRHGPRRHRPAGRRIACAGRARECGGARPDRPRTLCRSARRAPRPRSRRALGRIVVAAADAVRRLRPARGRHGGDRAGTAGADRRRPGPPDPEGRVERRHHPPAVRAGRAAGTVAALTPRPRITLVLHVLAPHSRWRPRAGRIRRDTLAPPGPGPPVERGASLPGAPPSESGSSSRAAGREPASAMSVEDPPAASRART
jgi:hypothetical protein